MLNNQPIPDELDMLLKRSLEREVPPEVEQQMLKRVRAFADRLESSASTPPSPRRRQRYSGLKVAVMGIAAVLVAAVALKRPALETWYIWQLESAEAEVRQSAAARLGDMRSSRAIPHLIDMLREESRVPETRSRVRISYGALRDSRSPPGYGSSQSPRDIVKWQSPSLPVSGRALVKIGRPAVPSLIGMLEEEENEGVNFSAAATLAEIGPPAIPALIENLENDNKKVRELVAAALGARGRVVDHEGQTVAGARVFLAGTRGEHIVNGEPCSIAENPKRTQTRLRRLEGDTAFSRTDAAGHFVLRGAEENGNSVVVLAENVHVWKAPVPDIRQEVTITLPEPATLVLRYDIEDDAPEADFALRLDAEKMRGWGRGECLQYLAVSNGEEVVLENLTPGQYELSRTRSLRAGNFGLELHLDRHDLRLKAGTTSVVDLTREQGIPIAGRITGLPEKATPGVFLTVEATKTAGFYPVEALTCKVNGEFKTARISPGEYIVRAEAYEPKRGRSSYGERSPSFTAAVKVTVPASGALEPIILDMRSRDD